MRIHPEAASGRRGICSSGLTISRQVKQTTPIQVQQTEAGGYYHEVTDKQVESATAIVNGPGILLPVPREKLEDSAIISNKLLQVGDSTMSGFLGERKGTVTTDASRRK